MRRNRIKFNYQCILCQSQTDLHALLFRFFAAKALLCWHSSHLIGLEKSCARIKALGQGAHSSNCLGNFKILKKKTLQIVLLCICSVSDKHRLIFQLFKFLIFMQLQYENIWEAYYGMEVFYWNTDNEAAHISVLQASDRIK